MASRDTSEAIARLIETARGSGLTPEEKGEIDLWQKGKALQQLSGFYGWDVLLEMLQSYPAHAVKQLLAVSPGDNERIIAAHAVAYALSDFYDKFIQDVQSAIDGAKAPEFAKQELHRMRSEMPLESLA